MTEEAAVDEAALDNPDPGCHAQTADEFETGNKTGEQVRAGDRAPGDVGRGERGRYDRDPGMQDRRVVRVVVVRSEEHTSELQSLMRISYAVFCLKNKILSYLLQLLLIL